MKTIPIFFSADRNYLPYLSVTLCSLAARGSDGNIYDVRVLSSDISSEELSGLLPEGAHRGIRLAAVNPERYLAPLRERLTPRLRDYYSEAIFYRLFIPSLYPELSRAIYLDCDTVLNADPAELYLTDLGGAVLGAVSDESVVITPAFSDYVQRWIGVSPEKYFNSGVLVMDLDAMRREHVEDRFINHLISHDPKTVAPDQDYLNYLLQGRIHYLDGEWNRQPCHRGDGPAKLLHYNFYAKPWRYRGVRYEELFWEYARESPYYEELCSELRSYSEDERQRDREGGERLLREAARLASSRGSFAAPAPRRAKGLSTAV